MNGPIPDAPGLADLDELYPDIDDETPELTQLPEIPPPELPSLPIEENPQKKKRLLPPVLALALLVAAGVGAAIYLGLIEV
jgi:hypothetical protein